MCQADLIGHLTRGARIEEMIDGIKRPGWVTPPNPYPHRYTNDEWAKVAEYQQPKDSMKNEAILERLRSIVIRHSKGQRIGGEVALALPESECTTTWLDMTADEKLLYDLHHCAPRSGWRPCGQSFPTACSLFPDLSPDALACRLRARLLTRVGE